MRLLKKMVSVGVQPDTVTLNAVIDSHARAGLVQQAMGWLNRTIRGEFDGVSADVVSYTILISALSRRGRLAAARLDPTSDASRKKLAARSSETTVPGSTT